MLPTAFAVLWISGGALAESVINVDLSSREIDYRRTAKHSCSVCFSENDEDCVALNTDTCEFYNETTKILASDMTMTPCPKGTENTQLKAEVDSKIFSVLETGLKEAETFTISDECIPFISTYTDCDKENICTGCETCKCDAFGRWNCRLGQKCRPDFVPSIAYHDILARVIETLEKSDSYEFGNNRVKRWTLRNEALATVNIMKREISTPDDQEKLNNHSELGSVILKNMTPTMINKFDRLKSDVLDPIDSILKDKQKEIQELLRIKEGLINITNSHKEVMNETNPDTMFSILKIDVPHKHKHHHVEADQGNANDTLNKSLMKLKKDVYEVIVDIINIRQLFSDKKLLPPEIKHLTQAMNHYIRKTGFLIQRRSNVITDSIRGFKLIEPSHSSSLVKNKVVEVLKILDINKPLACALRNLSSHTKRVIKRILEHVNEVTSKSSRISDPNYNLTRDLESIDARWKLSSSKIKESPAHEKLHNMKRLQVIVASDTAKLKDAIALVDLWTSK